MKTPTHFSINVIRMSYLHEILSMSYFNITDGEHPFILFGEKKAIYVQFSVSFQPRFQAQTNDSGTSSRDNLWLYGISTFVVLWTLGWLYRDSLEVENVKEKYVFVTGCDSGFGNLLCKRLDQRGFRVIAGCLTEKGADDLNMATGPYLKTVLLDVTSTASIQKAMEYTKQEVGDNGLWGIVNNAGRSLPMGPTEWMRMEDYTSTLKVNMTGVIEMTLTFLPLIKQAQGRIVNVASVLGRVAANGGGYCISKFAVESFSDCLRRDIHYFGIKVCIIEPGFFKTAVTSLDPIERELHRLWNQLTPEVKASYGDKYLDKFLPLAVQIPNSFNNILFPHPQPIQTSRYNG
ncbi:retinol dehydrogenase 7-like isoform X2 [Oncorhynchus tshawytscha]|uniref:retinol dehydrogenase 7-like isoform X2 n=1 Tax=Oncorhynchus tshawytscha TaxID=74940 RepID=UPI001C3D92F2|nr:retinol dehydrogenase 7-like isoform X2 [Oncorhynchus tshawytscha]